MTFAAKFDDKAFSSAGVSPDGHQFHFGQSHSIEHHATSSNVVTVPDAHLLFSGDYSRAGVDLVLTGENQKYIVHDYFKGDTHPVLASPDGATLSPAIVDALTGHTAYADNADAPSAGQVIGHVLKLTGSASVIRNGVTIELGIGDAVMKGDVVQTGSDSSIGMTFMDGSAFGMTSNARMVLNDMVYDPNGSSNSSLISLVQGTITFVAGQTAKNGHMRVETPVATMGIRGTAVLVEINSADGPTKFSVLVEPDGHTGSYNLYDKLTGALIGSVSQAGQVTFVSALGDHDAVTTLPKSLADQMSEKAIIQQVFQLYFPNYNPDANPKSNNRGDAGSSGNNLATINTGTPQASGPDAPPNTIQITVPHTDDKGHTTYTTVTAINTPASFFTISETENQNGAHFQNGSETETQNGTGFNIKDHVVIVDPDVGKPPFFDVATPFVAGSASIKKVRLATTSNLPAQHTDSDLEALLHIDQSTGQVSFGENAFKFLALGESVTFTLTFLSKSGPDTALQTLTFTITGLNDAPVVTGVVAGTATEDGATSTLHALANASDVDDGATLVVVNVPDNLPAGVTYDAVNHTFTLDPTVVAYQYLAEGATTTVTVNYGVSDGIVTTPTPASVSWTIHGTNDAAVIGTPTVAAVTEDVEVVHGKLIACGTISITDADQNQSTFQTSVTAAAGDLGQLVLKSDGSYTYTVADSAVQDLGANESKVDTFTVTAFDGTTKEVSFTIHGANDAPVLHTDDVSLTSGFSNFGFTHTFNFEDLAASDVDNHNDTYTLTLTDNDGVLSLHGEHNGVNVDSGLTLSGQNSHALSVSGSLDSINDFLSKGNGGFTDSTSSFETGQETIKAVLTDGHNGSDAVNFIFRQDVFPLSTATLTGTSGHDVFFSSTGNDTMVSGGGVDQFVFSGNFGHDTIQGFNQSNDTIEINGQNHTLHDLLQYATSVHNGADTLITIDPHDTILLKGIQLHHSGIA